VVGDGRCAVVDTFWQTERCDAWGDGLGGWMGGGCC
jgi:hypothetical protein